MASVAEIVPVPLANPLPLDRLWTAAAQAAPLVLTAAELAECTCPDWCERDHELD